METKEVAETPIMQLLEFSRDTEDQLDFQENALRSPEDIRRVDRSFLAGWSCVSGLWLAVAVLSAASVSGVAIAAIPLILRHFALHP